MKTPAVFVPPAPLPCPDCGVAHEKFIDHPVIGWLCEGCYERVQSACLELVNLLAKKHTEAA
jgi:hypothetical protein